MNDQNVIILTLPLPSQKLYPNRKCHWGTKAREAKQYRAWAMVVGMEATGSSRPMWDEASVQMTFFFSTNRRRDADNLLAAMKSALDGLADAGIIKNDSGFRHLPVETSIDKKNPCVVVTIQKIR